MLHPVAELGEDVRRHVLGGLGDEEDADALGADEPDRLGDGREEGLRGPVEEQVRLVEEEDELGLLQVADLRQIGVEVGEQPHQEGGEELRLVLDGRELQYGDQSAPVGGGPQELARVELGLPEELRGALLLEGGERPQDHPGRHRGQSADPLEFGFALFGDEEGDDRAQVLEVDQLQALGVGVVEDQAEGLLLRLVELEHLRHQHRAEAGDRGPERDPGADPAQRVEGARVSGGLPRLGHVPGPFGDPVARRPGHRDPRDVALDVREEDGDAARRQLFGDELERLGLACSGGSGDQSVAAQHRQGDADLTVGQAVAVPEEGPEVERGSGERVPGGDLPGRAGRVRPVLRKGGVGALTHDSLPK